MRLEQLQYIIETANQKSISKAAKNLYISQPSLSKAISQLEAELGIPIFVRLQQGVIPTTKGEIIINKARTILNEIEEIKDTASEKHLIADSDIFHVAMPLLLCNELFSCAASLLQKQFPTLTIIPYQYNTMDTIHDLSNETLDFGIISYNSTEKDTIEDMIKSQSLFMHTFSHEDFYVVTHVSSCWSQYPSIPYEALLPAKIVTFSDILRFCDSASFQTELAIPDYVPNKETIFSTLAKQKDAITIFPRSGALMNVLSYNGKFSAIPITNFPTTQYISGIFNSNKALPPHTQFFIDTLTEFYQQINEK